MGLPRTRAISSSCWTRSCPENMFWTCAVITMISVTAPVLATWVLIVIASRPVCGSCSNDRICPSVYVCGKCGKICQGKAEVSTRSPMRKPDDQRISSLREEEEEDERERERGGGNQDVGATRGVRLGRSKRIQVNLRPTNPRDPELADALTADVAPHRHLACADPAAAATKTNNKNKQQKQDHQSGAQSQITNVVGPLGDVKANGASGVGPKRRWTLAYPASGTGTTRSQTAPGTPSRW